MSNDELRERVAEALFKQQTKAFGLDAEKWDYDQEAKQHWLGYADVAISVVVEECAKLCWETLRGVYPAASIMQEAIRQMGKRGAG